MGTAHSILGEVCGFFGHNFIKPFPAVVRRTGRLQSIQIIRGRHSDMEMSRLRPPLKPPVRVCKQAASKKSDSQYSQP